MNNLKRASAFTAAAMLCLASLASCGGKEKTKKPQTADKLLTNSYKSVELTAPEGVSSIQSLTYLKESEKVLISCYDENYDMVLCSTDLEFSEYTNLNTELKINEEAQTSISFAAADDGSLYALVTTVTHGDIPEPDWQDPNFDSENFDYEAYEAAAVYSYSISKLDADGKLISENKIEGIDAYADESGYAYAGELTYIKDDKLLLTINGSEQNYVVLSEDGKLGDKMDIGENTWLNGIGKDKNGNIVCFMNEDGKNFFRDIDIDKKTFGDMKYEINNEGGYINGSIVSGNGDYILFAPMNNGIYGLKEDGTFEEIVNWVDSDIDSNYINAFLGLDNGDFVIFENDYEHNAIKLSRLTRRNADELADTTVMTIGMMWNDSEITSKITEFNKTNDKFRIKIKDYSEFDVYNEETEKYDSTAVGQLKNDIISGNAPDMICIYDTSAIQSLSSKGVFVDLYQFMNNDGDLSKDKFLPNIISACEKDGKLYSISPSFTISSYAAKTKNVAADKQDWTMDDMIEAYNNLPDGMDMFKSNSSKIGVYSILWYSIASDFIDYDKKTCSFDSPEFTKFLEFCNNFGDESDEPNYDDMTDEDWQKYWEDQETKCLNDKALIDEVYMSNVRDYARIKYAYFGGEDITFVGAPSSDGRGARLSLNYNFAILNDSGCKDTAWNFIKEFFTDEAQERMGNYGNMPVLTEYFEKMADESMKKPYYLDENGKKVEYDDSFWVGEKEVKLEPLTQEERDFAAEYIKNATRISGNYDQDIYSICEEEVQAYFAGEKSVEDAVKMIQNRVSILVSEQN